jgi:hypothetical protein
VSTRSILHARSAPGILQFWYGKRDPGTGLYYDATKITAAAIAVYDAAGTELLAPAAMTYSANLRGRRYNWAYGSALDAVDIVYAYVTPTRHSSVPAALAPDEVQLVDVSDLEATAASIRSKTDTLPASPAAVGSAMTLQPAERTAIANAVETEIIDETDSERVLQAIVDKIAAANPSLDDLTLGAIASAVRTELAAELARIDVTVGSRLADVDYTAPNNAGIASILALIPTAAAIADQVWEDLLAGHDTDGSFGRAMNALVRYWITRRMRVNKTTSKMEQMTDATGSIVAESWPLRNVDGGPVTEALPPWDRDGGAL